jgi:glucose/arabinose dehydrogenase
MKRALTIFAAVLITGFAIWFVVHHHFRRVWFTPTESSVEEGMPIAPLEDIAVIAQDLTIPWEIAFLPSGEMLVTERSGTLLKIGADSVKIKVVGVEHRGEGGLLGLAVHPRFAQNQWIYLYLTTRTGEGLLNRVERYRLTGSRLRDKTIILDNIPGASVHDGGRLAFGPDGYLYVTTGDAGEADSAQDQRALSGKILRVRDDGSIPDDNPFGGAVYSYGHRNVQGIAWDKDRNIWSTEHGRSGGLSGFDELNRIEKGANYGWPEIEGDATKSGMLRPALHSGPDETWAPAGAVYYQYSIFFTGLRGESLYEARIANGRVTDIRAHLRGQFGRLRAVTIGPEGFFYISTSNTDGRGMTREGDDKIIRINPAILEDR